MKLIIVDDVIENRNAAMEAVKKFPEHEFMFTSSAHEALGLLTHADGVITDLFFPREDEAGASEQYARYKNLMVQGESLPEFEDVVYGRNYRGDDWKAGNQLKRATRFLDNEASRQLPYGAAVTIAAKQAKKIYVLVTDMHRHATGGDSVECGFDALAMLLPLMADGVVTAEEVQWDGAIPQYDEKHYYTHSLGSKFYIASDRIRKLVGRDSDLSKNSPVVWVEAIRMAIDQSA